MQRERNHRHAVAALGYPRAVNDREFLRAYLAERDDPCPGCGYNLRGLTDSRCPECNQALVLAVRLAEPRLGAWITGLVGLCFGVGFSGLLLVYFVIIMVFGRNIGGMLEPLLVTAGPLLVEGIPLLLWILRRRAVQRLSDGARITLAAGCCLLTAANFAVFAVLIR